MPVPICLAVCMSLAPAEEQRSPLFRFHHPYPYHLPDLHKLRHIDPTFYNFPSPSIINSTSFSPHTSHLHPSSPRRSSTARLIVARARALSLPLSLSRGFLSTLVLVFTRAPLRAATPSLLNTHLASPPISDPAQPPSTDVEPTTTGLDSTGHRNRMAICSHSSTY